MVVNSNYRLPSVIKKPEKSHSNMLLHRIDNQPVRTGRAGFREAGLQVHCQDPNQEFSEEVFIFETASNKGE